MNQAERWKEEFWCDSGGGGCGKYFLTYMRSNMDGPFTVECPNCNHRHFRIITKGEVTGDRTNHGGYPNYADATVIVGMPSTIRDTPWHKDDKFLAQLPVPPKDRETAMARAFFEQEDRKRSTKGTRKSEMVN